MTPPSAFSNGEVPAQCAKMMVKARGSNAFAPENIVDFCRGSNSYSIGCMKRLITGTSKLSNKAKVEVCKHSSEHSNNLDCVSGVKAPRSFPADFPATFCSIDSPPPASIACANDAAKKLTAEETITLCQGAQSTAAFQCFSHKANSKLSSAEAVKLCSKAASSAPAECFKRAPVGLSSAQSIELCTGADSTQPAECAGAIDGKTSRKIGPEGVVELCKGARSTGPAACASSADSKLSWEHLKGLCQGGKERRGRGARGVADGAGKKLVPHTVRAERGVLVALFRSRIQAAMCRGRAGREEWLTTLARK